MDNKLIKQKKDYMIQKSILILYEYVRSSCRDRKLVKLFITDDKKFPEIHS